MRCSRLGFLFGLLSLGSRVDAQGAVHVVDWQGGPGADFTNIADAQQAAQPGDVVLVRGGTYGHIVQLGTVVAERGHQVRLPPLLPFLATAPPFLYQGLEFFNTGGPVVSTGPDAPIWFERCRFVPGGAFDPLAVRAGGVAFVLSQCVVLAGPSHDRALEALGGRIHVHASELRGELGPFGGGTAVRMLEDSFLELFGTLVTGADGADGTPSSCDGQDGVDAFHVVDTSRLVTLGSTLDPGEGGAPFGACSSGADGDAVVVYPFGASALALSGAARTLAIDSPVREGETLHVLVGGKPGDQVWLRYAQAPGLGIGATGLDGEFLLGSSSLALTATIPPSGRLDLTLVAPTLPAGWESTVFWCQAVLRDVDTHRFVVSAPSALVLLDETL